MFVLPEYGGLGGTGGQNCFPTESENVVSRLQLLGAGLTTFTHKTCSSSQFS